MTAQTKAECRRAERLASVVRRMVVTDGRLGRHGENRLRVLCKREADDLLNALAAPATRSEAEILLARIGQRVTDLCLQAERNEESRCFVGAEALYKEAELLERFIDCIKWTLTGEGDIEKAVFG